MAQNGGQSGFESASLCVIIRIIRLWREPVCLSVLLQFDCSSPTLLDNPAPKKDIGNEFISNLRAMRPSHLFYRDDALTLMLHRHGCPTLTASNNLCSFGVRYGNDVYQKEP